MRAEDATLDAAAHMIEPLEYLLTYLYVIPAPVHEFKASLDPRRQAAPADGKAQPAAPS